MHIKSKVGTEILKNGYVVTDELNQIPMIRTEFAQPKYNHENPLSFYSKAFVNKDMFINVLEDTETVGDGVLKEYNAIHSMAWLLSGKRLHDSLNTYLSVEQAFGMITDATGVEFTVEGAHKYYAEYFQSLGDGESYLDMMFKFINRWEMEFEIRGNKKVFLTQKRHTKNKKHLVRYKMNLIDTIINSDITDGATSIIGKFGKIDEENPEDSTYVEYPYEIQELVEQYGERYHKPYSNENITQEETMIKYLKDILINSWKISTTLDMADIVDDLESVHTGDEMIGIDERLDMVINTRIIKTEKYYNRDDELYKVIATVGTKTFADSYTSGGQSKQDETAEILEKAVGKFEKQLVDLKQDFDNRFNKERTEIEDGFRDYMNTQLAEVEADYNRIQIDFENTKSELMDNIASGINETKKYAEEQIKESRNKTKSELNDVKSELSTDITSSLNDAKKYAEEQAELSSKKAKQELESTRDELKSDIDKSYNDAIEDSAEKVSQAEKEFKTVTDEMKEQSERNLSAFRDELDTGISDTKKYSDNRISESEKLLEDRISNIRVGGRNLLLNSNFQTGNLSPWLSNAEYEVVTIDGKTTIKLPEIRQAGIYQKPINDEEVIHSISFKAKAISNSSKIYIGYLGQPTGRSKQITISDEWETYNFTMTRAFDFGIANHYFHIYGMKAAESGFYITDIMLVKGNIAQDHSPAPEDLLSENKLYVDEQTGLLTQKVEDYQEKVTEVENGLIDYAKRTEVNNQFQELENGQLKNIRNNITEAEKTITQTIEELSEKLSKSEYRLDQDNIANKFDQVETERKQLQNEISARLTKKEFERSEIGGENLIENSLNGVEVYANNSDNPIKREIFDDHILLTPMASTKNLSTYTETTMDLEAGQYIDSVEVYSEVETEMRLSSEAGDYTVVPAKTWTRLYVYRTHNGGQYRVIGLYTKDDMTVPIKYRKYQTEKGTKAKNWSPSPKDNENAIGAVRETAVKSENRISILEEGIELKANREEVQQILDDELEVVKNNVQSNNAELKIQKDLINQKVSETKYQTDMEGLVDDIEAKTTEIKQTADSAKVLAEEINKDYVKQSGVIVNADNVMIGSERIGSTDLASLITVSPTAIDMITENLNLDGNLTASGKIKSLSLEAVNADIANIRTKVLSADSVTANALKVDSALIDKLTTTDLLAKTIISNNLFTNKIQTQSLNVLYGQIENLRTRILDADSVTSKALKVDTALIDKLMTGTLLTDKLSADSAFITKIKSYSLDAVYADISRLRSNIITSNSITASALQVDNALIDKLMTNRLLTNKLLADVVFASEIKAKSLEAVNGDISNLRTKILTSNIIESHMLNVNTAMVDRLFATTALVEQLTSKAAFIRNIEAIDLTAAQVSVGFNNVSSQVRITALGLETLSNGTRTMLLNGGGSNFYRDDYKVGHIGSSYIVGTNYRGLRFGLNPQAEYMAWSFMETDSDNVSTVGLIFSRGNSSWRKGFTFKEDVFVDGDIQITSNRVLETSYIRPNGAPISNRIAFTYGSFSGVEGAYLRYSNSNNGGIHFSTNKTSIIARNGNSGTFAAFHATQDGTGDQIYSIAIWNRTYSGAANGYVTSYGTLGRITSALKYKDAVENQFKDRNKQLEHSKKLFLIDPKTWYDKQELEIVRKELETGEKQSNDKFKLKRHFGAIADEFHDIGMTELVQYNENGDIEGLSYDRIGVHLIPIAKDHEERIEELEREVKELKHQLKGA